MKTLLTRVWRRMLGAAAITAGLSGCAVYAPPYAYDTTYPVYGYSTYGYPAYYGAPPVSIDLGFGYYSDHRHGGYRSHGGHGARHGYGHRHGGWRRGSRR